MRPNGVATGEATGGDDAVLHFDAVTFCHPDGFSLVQLREWTLRRGEHVCLFGPSGTGKSTVLQLAAGILLPQKGRVWLDGQDLGALAAGARDRLRAATVGFIFQQFNLIPYLSVRENMLLPHYFRGSASCRDVCERDSARILGLMGLQGRVLNARVEALSVGQQQRVAAARALAARPRLMLADEPTSALDSGARDDFLHTMFAAAAEQRCAVVCVSHDPAVREFFAHRLALGELFGAQPGAGRSHQRPQEVGR